MNELGSVSAAEFLDEQSTDDISSVSARAFLDLAPDENVSARKKALLLEKRRVDQEAQEPGFGEKAAFGSQKFREGLAEIPASTLESIAIFSKRMGRKHPLLGSEKPLEQYDTYKAAQAIRTAGAADPNPKLEGSVGADIVPNAVGSAVGFMAGGAAAKSEYLVPALLGSAVQAAQGYEDAIQHGASEDDAFKSYLLNAGIGTTEILPIAKILNRLDKASGGTFKHALVTAGKETLEEGLQEALQQVGQNAVAKFWVGYDPERELGEGVKESVAGAGATGFLLSILGSGGASMRRRMLDRRAKEAQMIQSDAAMPQQPGGSASPMADQPANLGSAGPTGEFGTKPGTYLDFEFEGKPLVHGPLPVGADIESFKKDIEKAWPGAQFRGSREITPYTEAIETLPSTQEPTLPEEQQTLPPPDPALVPPTIVSPAEQVSASQFLDSPEVPESVAPLPEQEGEPLNVVSTNEGETSESPEEEPQSVENVSAEAFLDSPATDEESNLYESTNESGFSQSELSQQSDLGIETAMDDGERSESSPSLARSGPVETAPGRSYGPVAGSSFRIEGQGTQPGGSAGVGVTEGSIQSAEQFGGEPAAIERRGAAPAPALAGQDLRSAVEKPIPQSAPNHVIEDSDLIGQGGARTKANQNLEAIQLLKQLEAENRNPTPEEKRVLARYTGWGGIPQAFDINNPEWSKVHTQLRQSLTDGEYRAARASTLNAHFTSIPVVRGIWEALMHMGFTGGRVLEPSAGVGNFLGTIPGSVAPQTQISAVELDSVTGRLLAKLYPSSQVHVMGFERAKLPRNSFDLVTGNVPFGAEGIYDPNYSEHGLNTHNYFIVRGLDLLKPGGVMMVITSSNTMDRPGSRRAREVMADKADLIAAIRLPNNAFKANAGTEVTTDVLIFRKKDGSSRFSGETFRNVETGKTYKGEDVPLNEYFLRHPENMLGKMTLEGTMYGEKEPALLPNVGEDIQTALKRAIERLPLNVFGSKVEINEPSSIGTPTAAKEGTLFLKEGTVYKVVDGQLTKPGWYSDKAKVSRAKEYVSLRDTAKELIAAQLNPEADESEITSTRERLNRLYDRYVERHGALGDGKSRFLEDDVEFPLALALEIPDVRVEEITDSNGTRRARKVIVFQKAEIFSKRTIFPRVAPSHAETISDAVNISLAYQNRLDLPYVARLLGKKETQARSALLAAGLAFENPETGLLESTDQYLSGNVRSKLKTAVRAASDNSQYQRNVEALQRVQPAPIDIQDISLRLGSAWIPPEAIQDFIREELQVGVKIYHSEETGKWHVESTAGWLNDRNATTYGTKDFPGHNLVELALNLKGPVVYRKIDENTREKDQAASLAALEKQEQIKARFVDWAKRSPEWGTRLAEIYNDSFNGTVIRRYEGPQWKHYPGASVNYELRAHQKSVVTRILQDSTLLAHAVGTGKTFIMSTAAMEMRRLGMAKKPMIVVQNATLSQFAASFQRLYPAAKILVPNEKQREAKNRQKLVSMIATGDWDSVLVPQSWINMLPDDPKREESYINERKEELESAKRDLGKARGRDPRVKDIERALKSLEERLLGLKDRKTDSVVTFEQLGVDALFVDEAHEYKKLEFGTQMDNVKGLDKGRSQRGFSMFMKMRHVQEKNGGKNTVFATGTPVSNTLAEAWNMMRFVRPDVLKAYHIDTFDQFASTFGDVIYDWELTAGGTWKQVQRFARFINGPELLSAWRTVADVVLKTDLKLPEPALRNGKPTSVTLEPTPRLRTYIQHLQDVLAEFEKMSGREKKANSHIPLVTFTNAKKASLDMRLIDSSLPDDETSKLNIAAERIAEIYQASRDVKGTQMVFADLYQNPDGKFNVYSELKRKLVARGLPERSIGILAEQTTEAARATLFQRMREGDVSVLIGSSAKMGVGVDVPQKMIALHHLDAPMRPMDMEQRNGRILRQGNENDEVEIVQYGVRGSLDAATFQKLETKQKFINQILSGDLTGRTFEDAADEVSMTFAEQKAAFSGDPRAMKKVILETQLRKLESLRRSDVSEKQKARLRQQQLMRSDLPLASAKLAADTKQAQILSAAFQGDYSVEVGNQTVSGKKDVSEALDALIRRGLESVEKMAEQGGFTDEVTKTLERVKVNGQVLMLTAVQPIDLTTGKAREGSDAFVRWRLSDDTQNAHVRTGRGLLASLDTRVEQLLELPKQDAAQIKAIEKNIIELSGFVDLPFAQEADYQSALEEQRDLLSEMERAATESKEENEAEERIKSHLAQKPGGMRIDFGRPLGGQGGFFDIRLVDDLIIVGKKFVREGFDTVRSWTSRMVKTFGAKISKYLNNVWNRIQNLQAAAALNLSPDGVANVNRIEAQQANVNRKPEIQPVYPHSKTDTIFRKMRRNSQRVVYFGSSTLLAKQQELHLTESYQAAAVQRQTANLWTSLETGAYSARPQEWKLPKWMRVGAWAVRLKQFQKLALPIAAHLNATGRTTTGEWAFSDFEMRAGFMPLSQFTKAKHAIGDVILVNNPLTGEKQELRIGNLIQVDGRSGMQLLRPMSAAQQKEIYEHYQNRFPELMWALDMFIDPALVDTRTQINGVEIPVFNRFALAQAMAANNPSFTPVDAYTPDVLVSRSLIGAISGFLGLKRGIVSPGRKYKTGAAREGGAIRDLFSGFNIRTFQMLQESTRRKFFQAVLKEAVKVPKTGVPDGYVQFETGIDEVWRAITRLQRLDLPGDAHGAAMFPEIESRLKDVGSAEYKAFFGEAAQLRGKQLMLPRPLVEMLVRKYAAQKVHGRLYNLGAWLVRNSTQLYLAMPKTYVANVLTNDLFSIEAAYRYALSGTMKILSGQGGPDLRFSREILSGMVLNRFAGIRDMLHAGNKTSFMRTVREVLPENIFADSTALADVKVNYHDSPWELLRKGEVGSAVLNAIKYGAIDVRAKQRFAYAFLKARAVSEAKVQGLRGAALRMAVNQYLADPPLDDRRKAVAAANFEYLNYADSPDWLNWFSRTDYGRLIIPFPRFGYHFLAKQAERLSSLKLFLGKVPAGQRADALADVITVATFGLGLGGLALHSFVRRLFGGDDDDDARAFIGTSVVKYIDESGNLKVKPIDRTLITANRINLSYWARTMGLGTSNEDDFWLRVRNYPALAMAGAAILAENDARKYGAAQGIDTYLQSVTDLGSDFFSLGLALKVPDKILAELRSLETGKPEPTVTDPFATNIPLSAYLTEQVMDSFVPGVRQFDETILWIDPIERRKTRSKTLNYDPGVKEALQVGHVTGLIDRLLNGGESKLPPAGPIDRKTGEISPRTSPALTRAASLAGFNVRAFNREHYEEAVRPK